MPLMMSSLSPKLLPAKKTAKNETLPYGIASAFKNKKLNTMPLYIYIYVEEDVESISY